MYDLEEIYIDLDFFEDLSGAECVRDDELVASNKEAVNTVSQFLGKPVTFFKGKLRKLPREL